MRRVLVNEYALCLAQETSVALGVPISEQKGGVPVDNDAKSVPNASSPSILSETSPRLLASVSEEHGLSTILESSDT